MMDSISLGLSWQSAGSFAFSLAEQHDLVRSAAGKGFLTTIRPNNVDGINVVGRSKTEMSTRVVAA